MKKKGKGKSNEDEMKRGEERKKEENLHQKEDHLLKEELLQDQITDLIPDITDLLSR